MQATANDTMARPPIIAITPGEPAGIGPDICLRLPAARDCALVLVADPDMLQARARLLGVAFPVLPWPAAGPINAGLYVLPVRCHVTAQPGVLERENAAYVIETLQRAVAGCRSGEFGALVTGPAHKGVINDAGIPFSGHTELLAELCGVATPVMMLAAPGLRVALATTHLPLAEVSRHITREHLRAIVRVLDTDLREKFGIARPRILVCGLNPHAGEFGHLGREEIEVIEPVLAELRAEGMQLRGPVPADTAFLPAQLQGTDAVLAMYHDQGLPVLKHHDFAHAVNITLGLPFIRTSVDHGTALELAGSGRADPSSLHAALDTALALVRARTRH